MNQVKVKICGITNVEDGRVAVEAGADILGFILYARSPRYITSDQVAEIIQAIDASSSATFMPKMTGVFVNEPPERVQSILEQTGLDYAQLHSEESPDVLAQLQGRAFKALRPASPEEAEIEASSFATLGPPDGPRWLIDAYDPNAYGGTGKKADWHTAAQLSDQYPGLLLAGGLTPENVAEAIHVVKPWGVDVSSGVEAEPGLKDHAKVNAFIKVAKGAGAEPQV